MVACRSVCSRELLLESSFRQDIRSHKRRARGLGIYIVFLFSMLWYKPRVSGVVAVIDLYMVKWCLIDDRRNGVQTRRSELSWSNTRDERKLMPCLIASAPSMAANTRHHDIFLPTCISLEFGVYSFRMGCEFLRRLCCGHRSWWL